MQLIDLTLPDAADNLALDEALLESADEGLRGEVLRFWESPSYFVVLGYSSAWRNEVIHAACQRDHIPILRRKSGGQTVLQGAGCLNFSLILKSSANSGIRSDTQRIMQCHRDALGKISDKEIKIQGISDLTGGDKKFSGNAMRRGKNHYLFHGTFLYDFDLSQISRYLGKPDREPAYRLQRTHGDFLENLNLTRKQIKECLTRAWQAEKKTDPLPLERIPQLRQDYYDNPAWNLKY